MVPSSPWRLPWNNNPRKLHSAGSSGGTAARVSIFHSGSRTAPRHQCPNADCGPGQTCIRAKSHHCLAGLFARDKHLVHDFAKACSLVLFLARPRAGTAGVETCKERLGSDGPVGVVVGLGPVGHLLACWSVPLARIAIDTIHASQRVWHASEFSTSATRRNPGLS